MSNLGIADILAVRNTGTAALLIRLGAALEDKPNISNHVIVVHHQDANGRWWGLQGQPGGVGWCQLDTIAASPLVIDNIGQPGRDDAARARVAQRAEAMLGTPYDWVAITDDAVRAFAPRAKDIWDKPWSGTLAPGHVVCSSYAAWLYKQEGWAYPDAVNMREIEPADWDEFCLAGLYSVSPVL